MKIYVVKRILVKSVKDGYVTHYSDGVAYFASEEKARVYVEEHATREVKNVVYQITENGLQPTGQSFPLDKAYRIVSPDKCVKVEEVVYYNHKVFEVEVEE